MGTESITLLLIGFAAALVILPVIGILIYCAASKMHNRKKDAEKTDESGTVSQH